MRTDTAARGGWLAVLALIFLPLGAAAQDPLSAIDWLDEQAATPGAFGVQPRTPKPSLDEPPAGGATIPEVTVAPLDDTTSGDAVGLLPSRVTGFPPSLWEASETGDISDLLIAQNVDGQPAMQALLLALLLAEALPPENADGRFLLARIDRLIELGAVQQAIELIALSDPTSTPALFSRAFDLSLLSGPGDAACDSMIEHPHLAPDLSARIFCLARSGQWSDALTTLATGHALGDISSARYGLLLNFLDPEMAGDLPRLPPPARMTPLDYRLHEAMGEPLPSSSLPRAFAIADLNGDSGWKAQIEAAERLVRANALSEQRLFAIYGAGRPSASGGVWDRVDAVQRFRTALTARDPQAVGTSLLRVWPLMQKVGLETAFAKTFADALVPLPLSGGAATVAVQAALLSPRYEILARKLEPTGPAQSFAVAVAAGTPDRAAAPSDRARAITEGFSSRPAPNFQAMLDAGKLGEAVLRAMSLAYQARLGDDTALTEALAVFRAVGLEDTARRMALQMLLLPAES